ncbi:MAG: lytic transglycosylase domain-containing protein, partial [Syntrophomonadaceae bacterium]
PQTNINFGCWYLASLSKEFDGQVPLMVAAYNAGRGTVQQWIAGQIWDGDPERLESIPFEETREYVRNVLKNYEAYQVIYTEP